MIIVRCNNTFQMISKVIYIPFYKNLTMNFEIFADEIRIKDKNGNEFLSIGVCLSKLKINKGWLKNYAI